MPRRQIALTAEEREALLERRDHAALPYVRERAAAVLKVADGMPAAVVARQGLLRPREPDTVYAWLDRYHAEGLAGLAVRTGRGRKPAFSPGASHRRRGPGGVAVPLPARPARVRGDSQSVDLGDPARGLPVAGRPHAERGSADARAAEDRLETTSCCHP